MKRILAMALACVAVCCSVFAMSGCAAVVEVKGIDCQISGDYPHESKGSPGFVVSKGRVTCFGSGTVRSVTASLKIQKKVGRIWSDVAGTIKTESFTNVRLRKRITIQNRSMTCRRGVFRTAVRIESHIDGHDIKVFGGGWGYSKRVVDPCG